MNTPANLDTLEVLSRGRQLPLLLAIDGVTTVGSPATLPRAVSHQGGAHTTHTPAVRG
jgi:hypothetical protein